MDISSVEAAIQAGYNSGQRLATAIDVEGGRVIHPGLNLQRSMHRTFFLFFEHYEDFSKNVPHCAYITLASRLRFPSIGFCQGGQQSFEYDTKILRDTWGMARAAGWQVAEMFDTGREKAHDIGHGYHRTAGPTFKDSMLVFEAPLTQLVAPPPHPGLLNMGQAQGGISKEDQLAPGMPVC